MSSYWTEENIPKIYSSHTYPSFLQYNLLPGLAPDFRRDNLFPQSVRALKHINYKELYNLVKPYVKEEHLSFSLPNDCTDGKEWGNIYSHDKPIGQILIAYIEE